MRCLAFAALLASFAIGPIPAAVGSGSGVPSAHAAGGPRVELDRLQLPPDAKTYETFLRRTLRREASQVDWGASAGSTIEYRYEVEKLDLVFEKDVLIVKCSAIGRLPRGRTARSQLTFGGAASQRRQLVERVLTIVARGVLTRLSELERERRQAQ